MLGMIIEWCFTSYFMYNLNASLLTSDDVIKSCQTIGLLMMKFEPRPDNGDPEQSLEREVSCEDLGLEDVSQR
jgi:hypothetical protein